MARIYYDSDTQVLKTEGTMDEITAALADITKLLIGKVDSEPEVIISVGDIENARVKVAEGSTFVLEEDDFFTDMKIGTIVRYVTSNRGLINSARFFIEGSEYKYLGSSTKIKLIKGDIKWVK